LCSGRFEELVFQNYKHPSRVVPATVVIIAAAVLVFIISFQVRDRFLDPEIKTTEQAEHSTTGMVVRDAGARLLPTDPKLSVEPQKPKTYQSADHPAPERPAM
jgi:hypothetical protein